LRTILYPLLYLPESDEIRWIPFQEAGRPFRMLPFTLSFETGVFHNVAGVSQTFLALSVIREGNYTPRAQTFRTIIQTGHLSTPDTGE
jgi:hypothetical protein